MDFFESQDRARSLSVRLTVLFTLSVVFTIVLVHGLIASIVTIFSYSDSEGIGLGEFFFNELTSSTLLGKDCALVLLTIFSGMFFKSRQIKKGGCDKVLNSLNATKVSRDTTNPLERKLYNVVEEMAIASGMPVPQTFILKGVESINACAVGFSPEIAAVCVTHGALKYLNRDEIQGVVAHEFSHIYHSDMKLNMRLLAILFGIELFVIFGSYTIQMAFTPSRDSDDKTNLSVFFFLLGVGLSLICIGWTGVLFGNMMRAAVTRQREYLADASAVQFTRNPEGLANALRKIGRFEGGTSVDGRGAQQAAHFFFAPVFSSNFMLSLFRTHPPLIKRIKAIDPSFDGVFPKAEALADADAIVRPSNVDSGDISLLTELMESAGSAASAESIDFGAERVIRDADSISTCSSSDCLCLPQELYGDGCKLEKDGEDVLEARTPSHLSVALNDFIDSVENARAIVFGVLLNKDSQVYDIQRDSLQKRYPSSVDKESLEKAIFLLEGLSDSTRLQVVRICIPLLKGMTAREYDAFRRATFFLCGVDKKIDVLEYTLQSLVIRELDVFFGYLAPLEVKYSSLSNVKERLVNVLAALAYQGALKDGDAELAFEKGCSVLGLSAQLPPCELVTLRTFTESLNELAKSSPQLKKLIMEACWRCVLYDEVVTERESVLLSATAAALGIPAPFWLSKKTGD